MGFGYSFRKNAQSKVTTFWQLRKALIEFNSQWLLCLQVLPECAILQGFWHVAANCRHLPRCVRCGEPHSVEFCPRPRSDPVCCHCAGESISHTLAYILILFSINECSGPHHAAYRQCPVRLQLVNATPVSITLTSGRKNSGGTLEGFFGRWRKLAIRR